ncbi:hypothetical protein [Chryseobacterium sp. MMS23-Vi53]|uniref:hypothetical protein n=1 Tax=Chryseobacterium sp. MMS23-Vi53 TaxID=3386644 RepID=UPI0039E77DD3
MKKLIAASILLSNLAIAQIGIQTANPMASLHVDAGRDNLDKNDLSQDQQSNDFAILKDGSVGIGTIAPKGKLDIESTNSGFVPPRLNNDQRDNIPVGRRPPGTMIYNTQASKLQVNVGTDEIPVWTNLDTSSNTINTSVVFSKTDEQTITHGSSTTKYYPVTFQSTLFSNVPGGFITKKADNTTIALAPGKTYKVEVNMGRLLSSDNNHTWCRIIGDDGEYLSAVSILPNIMDSWWNTFNTMLTFIKVTGAQKTINVSCQKQGAGSVIINHKIAPIVSITIMD